MKHGLPIAPEWTGVLACQFQKEKMLMNHDENLMSEVCDLPNYRSLCSLVAHRKLRRPNARAGPNVRRVPKGLLFDAQTQLSNHPPTNVVAEGVSKGLRVLFGPVP